MTEYSVRRLPVQHIEREAFAKFGTLIAPETADSPRLNRAPGHFGYLWVQKELEFPKTAYMCALRYYHRGTRCEFLQKHPASTIVLIAMGAGASVFYAAPDDGHDHPDVDEAQAFLLRASQGIVLHRGIWVRYAYPVGEFSDFAYVTQRVDPATANSTDDVVRSNLDKDFGIVLEASLDPAPGAPFEFGPSGAVVSGPPRHPPSD